MLSKLKGLIAKWIIQTVIDDYKRGGPIWRLLRTVARCESRASRHLSNGDR